MGYHSDSKSTLNTVRMLRDFFTKKAVPLSGAPPIRRLKTYSAQSGYVYQYFYEGQRPLRGEAGTEFVFTVDRGPQEFTSRQRPGT